MSRWERDRWQQPSTDEHHADTWLVANAAVASFFVLACLLIGIFVPLRAPSPGAAVTDLSAAAVFSSP